MGLALAAGMGAPAEAAGPHDVVVRVAPEAAGLPGFEATLAGLDWIRRAGPGEAASLSVAETPRGFVVEAPGAGPLAPAISSAAPDAGVRLAEELIGRAHRRWIASLANPTGPAVDFVLGRAGGGRADRPLDRVEPGTELRWEARNDSETPLFVSVFAVSPDRGVTLVYPFRSKPGALEPGGTVDQKGIVDLPEGERVARDRLQLVATRAWIDPERFLDPRGLSAVLAELGRTEWTSAHHEVTVRRQVAEVVDASESPLAVGRRMLDAGLRALDRSRSAPGAAPTPATAASDPIVDARELAAASPKRERRVRRRPPRTLHFGVHFEGPVELGAVQGRVAKLRTLCGRGGRACEITRLFPEGQVFELERTGRRLREGTSQTVGDAWEQAYEIRRGLEALRVEPFLELETFGADLDRLETMDAAGGAARGAADDWHLGQVRARDAWAELRRRGRGAGREAEGIRVALVDTGYRPHPEVWDGAGAPRPVRAAAGWDYVDDDDDALDPGAPGASAGAGLAHGTASASLLASPTGCQLAGQQGCAHGVARGAELAPLRAHRAATHYHAGRLARVLYDAATGGLPEPVDLVTVSMGGPPGWALWEASRRAESAGLLVLAPAGDAMPTVVWPARFASTVAVSATGPGCRPWPAAAHGPGVDIAAPGEGVWHADVAAGDLELNEPGSGTALATAVAGGAAALWLRRWQDGPALAGLRASGRLTAAFRDALRRSAWTPARPPRGVRCEASGGWDRGFGPGLLDAAALVARAPRAPGAAPEAPGLRDLPLFRSVYPDGGGERAAADYRRLFGLAPDAELESVAYLEAELLHHYAMTREVTEALDVALARGAPDAAFAEARQALLRQGLSRDLRRALDPED